MKWRELVVCSMPMSSPSLDQLKDNSTCPIGIQIGKATSVRTSKTLSYL